uniref:RNA-binding protein 5-B isoform X2 n=1 Tax=Rhizophora mucronata TaxID=61149 RepID=A0A2P2MAC5_RHIMU
MKKTISLIGSLGDMRNHVWTHTLKWILFVIARLIQLTTLISSERAIEKWTTIMIMDLTGLLGLGDVTMMTMHMMTMTINIALLIQAGKTVVRGTMNMVGTVMILTMIEAIEEMATGSDVNLEIESVIREGLVGKEI